LLPGARVVARRARRRLALAAGDAGAASLLLPAPVLVAAAAAPALPGLPGGRAGRRAGRRARRLRGVPRRPGPPPPRGPRRGGGRRRPALQPLPESHHAARDPATL